MNRLTFYGASDDLVEIDGTGDVTGADEFNVYAVRGGGRLMGTWRVNDVLDVHAYYNGDWFFAPALVEGDPGYAEWDGITVRVERTAPHSDYSTLLVIESAAPLTVVSR